MASGRDQNHLPVSLAVSFSVRTLDFLVGLRSDNGRRISEIFRSCEAALTAFDISDRIRLQNFRSCEAALNASDFVANVSLSVKTLDFLVGFSDDEHKISENFLKLRICSDRTRFL